MSSTRRRFGRLVFVTGFACLSVLPGGCAQQALYRGSQAAGEVRTIADIRLPDPVQGRDVMVRLHYPADASGPLPLVVYSHGARCSAANYDLITRYWAAHGYAVLAPTHRDAMDNPVQPTEEELPMLLPARIRDLSFLLDALDEVEAQAGTPGLFDRRHIAVSGHSFGGMVAEIKSGARIDPAANVYPGPIADPRYKAAVIMSGVGPMPPFTDDAFDGLTGPLIATGGTLDLGNTGRGIVHPWEWRVAAYDLAPPGDKYRVVLDEGDHYLGGLICRADRGGPADPGGVEILQTTTTAFLDAYLRGDAQALSYLRSVDLEAVTGGRAGYLVK
jgi:dienelactone hydrolase